MKQALIVGGNGGLGSALVKLLLDRNLQVAVAGRSRAADDRVRHSHVIDATSEEWGSLYSAIERESAIPIDAVVFVAGTSAYGRTAAFPPEKGRDIFELNFWACAAAATMAAKHWDEAGRAGKFVAVLSIAGRRAVPFEAYYTASKAAAMRFLECLELEYAAKDIHFLSAFPGTLNTPFRRNAEWYGMAPPLSRQAADVQKAAEAICKLLEGTRTAKVIGWRERAIDLADRLSPGAYDRLILRRRVLEALNRGASQRASQNETGQSGFLDEAKSS
jgi:short-subunit dehydrogenase